MTTRYLILVLTVLAACAPPVETPAREEDPPAAEERVAALDGSELNETPPPTFLVEEVVPYTTADEDAIRARINNIATEDAAAQTEIDARVGAGAAKITLSLVDQYGTYYARAQQRVGDVGVEGGEVLIRKKGDTTIDNFLIANVAINTIPGVPAMRAIMEAESLYPLIAHDTHTELMIVPGDAGPMLQWLVTLTPSAPTGDPAGAPLPPPTEDTTGDDTVRNNNASGRDDDERSFDLNVDLTFSTMLYRVAAATGDFIEAEDLSAFAGDCPDDGLVAATAVGFGHYNGRVELSTMKNGDKYEMTDRTHTAGDTCNQGNRVYHSFGSTDLTVAKHFTDKNNIWGTGDGTGFDESIAITTSASQTPAVDVMFSIQVTQKMLKAIFGRVGFDGKGSSVSGYVHYDTNYGDARNIGGERFVVGDGSKNNPLLNAGLYSLSVVAHELGHEVFGKMGHKAGNNESRAINEGMADVQRALADVYHRSHNDKGTSLQRIAGGWDGRTLNPEGYSERNRVNPACPASLDPLPANCLAFGQRYWTSNIPNLPEHVGGIPFTRAVMHLAEGSDTTPGRNYYSALAPGLVGIGLTKAAQIWHLAMAQYAITTPTYANLQTSFIGAATQLYGANSPEVRATQNAWAAIGIGQRVTGTTPPTAKYLGIFNVDQVSRTATLLAVPQDDTGSASVICKVFGNEITTMGGYAIETLDLSTLPPGESDISILLRDSDGNITPFKRKVTMNGRDVLTQESSLEKDIGGAWKTTGDKSKRLISQQLAVTGNSVFSIIGNETVYQDVVIPPNSNDGDITYYVSVLPGARTTEKLVVELQDDQGQKLLTLGTYGSDFASKYEGKLMQKKFLKEQRDIKLYMQKPKLRIAFIAQDINPIGSGANRFLVDHVIMTRAEAIILDSAIQVYEPDQTVHVTTDVSVDRADYKFINYTYDGRTVRGSNNAKNEVYASIEGLKQGLHLLKGHVIGHDDTEIATFSTAFFVKAYNELLQNGELENGLASWQTITETAPEIFTNGPDLQLCYRGASCLIVGGHGKVMTTSFVQEVQLPSDMKTLELSVRSRVQSTEKPDPFKGDHVVVRIVGPDDVFITGALLRDPTEPNDVGLLAFNGDWNRNQTGTNLGAAFDVTKLNGKKVRVRFDVYETGNGRTTTWLIDEVSLHYTTFGFDQAPMDPAMPPKG